MQYIFFISFGTIKIFKFQISYYLKKIIIIIIIIIKTYYIIIIDITQITDSTNQNLFFPVLKLVH